MSTTTNLADSLSSLSETAEVRLVSRQTWPRSEFRVAYVLVSCRIYWKVANKDRSNKPKSLLDFQNADSLELVRPKNGTWNEVDEVVKVDNYEGRSRITVQGNLHRRTRMRNVSFVRNVSLEILANTHEQREFWVNQIQARIAPWDLLQQEIKDIASGAAPFGVEQLGNALGRLATIDGTRPSSLSPAEGEGKWSTIHTQMGKLSMIDKLTAQGTGAVGSGATFAGLVSNVEHVAETAKLIGDVSKGVAGVSSIFNLVALCAEGVSMWAEANRGQRVLPAAIDRMGILLEYELKSLAEIVKPSRGVNEIDVDFVFDALRETVCRMDMAETQLLQGRVSQIVNAGNVKEVEDKLKGLIHQAVTTGLMSKISAIREEMKQLKKEQEICTDGLHHVRPSLSSFFSGRTKELDKLRDTLEKHGSAVITQYGGVGKTELTIALADRAERDGVVPGGVFWVTIDGGESEAIRSLARLAEKLTGWKLDEEEGRNGNLVVAALKQGLDGREGRWLLCLDNADDNAVSGVLNEVCGIVRGAQGNGWVVVTSRQGQPHIWSGMTSEQKLVLEPLCEEDAMVALWRKVRKIRTDIADDDEVMNAINELRRANAVEYRALKELCGYEGGCSLGGLPLALVQAGAYMARFECSFSRYRNMFENANRMEDMHELMRNTEEMKPIEESQRSIWTTWKISVRRLTKNAYSVLRAMAMLWPGGVGEAIVKRIVEGVAGVEEDSVGGTYQKVVIEELVQGSSLICRSEGKREGYDGWMYRMHRLVQRFIVTEMERGSELWNDVFSVALVTVHEVVEAELDREGTSFEDFREVFGDNHREFVAHATMLVDHYTLPAQGATIRDVSEVEDILWYSGVAMEFMGKPEESVKAWERLADTLHHRQAANRMRSCFGGLLDVGFRRKRGKWLKQRTARVYNSLGLALERNGQPDNAASMLEQTHEMYLAIHGHDKPHPAIATSLSNLGLVFAKLGEFNKALEKHQESLAMKLAIHGHDKPHPAIATSLSNLGSVYEELGEFNKALEKHQESLAMDLAIHGLDKAHPHIAISLFAVGILHHKRRALHEAIDFLQRCLEMLRILHAETAQHSQIKHVRCCLADVYEDQGRRDEAAAIRKRNECDIGTHETWDGGASNHTIGN